MADAPPPESALLMTRIGELWLKGNNRTRFLRHLRRNLRTALAPEITDARLMPRGGRIFVIVPDATQAERAMAICADTPGLVDVSRVIRCPPTLDAIEHTALEMVQSHWRGATGSFAVWGRRKNKRLPFTAPGMCAHVGGAIQRATGLTVDLDRPDRTISVEVSAEDAHLWVETVPGSGGLPVGSSGHALLLLSGGIDSPVAGYLAQKRGCRVEAIYFHSAPFVGEATRDKVLTLARRLARRQGVLIVHIVPFTPVQIAIRDMCDPRLRVMLYRRFMYRIADRVADLREIEALCTGEMLGQVASQTLRNLSLVDQLTDRVVLRPLMTHDKQESIDLARRIGTYRTSVLPHDDCCALFLGDFPSTRASGPIVRRQEDLLSVDRLVDAAVEGIEQVRI